MAKEPIPEAAREYFRKIASKAGKASAEALTPAQRKKKATKAATARWGKRKK
jgi:hypothetical protein